MDPKLLASGLVWYPVFLFSAVVHEAAHAFAAKLGGDLTAYQGGQVSLDPIPHIRREPFGMIAVPLVSFMVIGWMMGWASAPYDPVWAEKYPRRSALKSFAGPLANLALAILAGAAIRIGSALNFLEAPTRINLFQVTTATGPNGEFWALLLSIAFSLNLILFVFNLLPVPPLDGSQVIPLLTPASARRTVVQTMNQPYFGLIGLVVALAVFDRVFVPFHLFALNMLYPGVTYGWN